MARLEKGSPLHGLRGILGKYLVFRQVGGETIVSQKVCYDSKSSEAQKNTRGKFREASEYSKTQMRIPERKEYYKKVAKKLNLPNAYTAAVTEFMRKPVIEDVRIEKKKNGRALVKVKAYKKGYGQVAVRLVATRNETEEPNIVRNGNSLWESDIHDFNTITKMKIEAYDDYGNCSATALFLGANSCWRIAEELA